MADLSQLSDDDLIQLFNQESQAALGGGNQGVPTAQQPSPQPGKFVTTGLNVGGLSTTNLDALKQTEQVKNQADIDKQTALEGIKGPSGEIGGRIALARESMQRLRNIKRMIFPDGTPKSFRRDLALGANLPGISLPGFGRVTPTKVGNVPFTEADDPFVNDAQDLHRELGTILSGRQLIQTGVAARPEETERLVEQFAPNVWSGAESAMNGLNQLESFYKDYLKVIDPSGAKGASSGLEDSDPLGIR
jgi:hypothetical protein